MTNLDNIRKMNSEELAEILSGSCCKTCIYKGKCRCNGVYACKDGVKAWLEQEVTHTLSDDEKVILRNIGKKFKTIKRNYVGSLYLECDDKIFKYQEQFSCYNNLFDFIKDGDSYEISKLLGE